MVMARGMKLKIILQFREICIFLQSDIADVAKW